jgi:hypothetical protein
MDWNMAIAVTAVVGVLGTLAAILWWRLAFKRIPYKDDASRRTPPSNQNVVIIRDEDIKSGS